MCIGGEPLFYVRLISIPTFVHRFDARKNQMRKVKSELSYPLKI